MDWYFPSWNGDFRLLPGGITCVGNSVLEIVEPTLGERELINSFLTEAKERGWTRETKLNMRGWKRRKIKIKAPVDEVGQVLMAILKPGPDSLTAIKYADGSVTVANTVDEEAVAAAVTDDPPALEEPKPEKKKPKAKPKKKPKKAATVNRPTPCCPACIPGSVKRASDVLLSFLTDEQHEQWANDRAIIVTGHLSGHRYLVAHRHSKLAIGWGRHTYDLDDHAVMHWHDWSVPPEEEVLAAKLILEHREPWLRNEATWGPGATGMFKNPFGGFEDGVADAAFTSGIGAFLQGFGTMYGAIDGPS